MNFRRRVALAAGIAAAVMSGIAIQGPATPATAAPTTFTHPGILLGRAQLDLMRTRVRAGAEPWKSAYTSMLSSPFASLDRKPAPRAVVECGPYSVPNNGCTDEREDAIAAYTQALAWYITGDERYARKSIELMDAWSGTITSHTNSNAPLQSAWAASSWTRAAEIMRYTYIGWPAARVTRFANMLRDIYLPQVFLSRATYAGNWELTMMEAAVGISVFIEDRASYDRAVTKYRNRVPAYIYLPSDGAYPKGPSGTTIDTKAEIVSYWYGQSTFITGLTQETCRDFEHTGYGLSAIAHIAETTRLQGLDLYPEIKERLRQAIGQHARWQVGEPMPKNICGGSFKLKLGPTTEVGFNALHDRLGIPMTKTQQLTKQQRLAGTNKLFVSWETLTNAGG